MANSYQVFVDDNFHHQDEDERYKLGDYATAEEAIAACRKIVDEFLQQNLEKSATATELYENYKSFGEDPFIVGEPAPYFSAWSYAEQRCRKIYGES